MFVSIRIPRTGMALILCHLHCKITYGLIISKLLKHNYDVFIQVFQLISISYMVSLRSAHSCSHARLRSTSAFASTSLCRSFRSLLLAHSLCSYARPHALWRARGLCGVANAPASARSLWSHADTPARLTPRLLLPTLPGVARGIYLVCSRSHS